MNDLYLIYSLYPSLIGHVLCYTCLHCKTQAETADVIFNIAGCNRGKEDPKQSSYKQLMHLSQGPTQPQVIKRSDTMCPENKEQIFDEIQ